MNLNLQDKLAALVKTVVKADKYRKGVPPAFPESQPKYLQDELTKLEQVSDLIYDDVVQTVENGKTLKAAYDEEKTLRAEGDEALAQRITTLAASVESGTSNAAALVKLEETARVNADGALSQRIADLSATLGTADSSLAARITTEEKARASADSALSQRITDLSATVDTADTSLAASITTEEKARASADSALSQRITDLTSTMNTADSNLSARITAEETARVNAVNAEAKRITDLTASTNTANGNLSTRITNEETARVNGDSANASAIQTLTSTVNGHTTTISQQAQTINGISARWGIRIVNGNRVAGVQLNSAADGTSSFDIEANTFNLFRPGTNERYLYWDGSQLVVRGNILATSVTTDAALAAMNSAPSQTLNRPVVGKPTIVAQGTHYQNFSVGATNSTVSINIPTGISVGSDWTQASSDLYIATATISAGSPVNGGNVGRSLVSVVVGDGINGGGAKGYYADGQIYINYQFIATAGQGSINVTAINWKLSRI